MRVFFLSETLCGLTVGGIYLGLVDGFERSAEIEPKNGLFCELNPAGEFLPVSFHLNDDFLHDPPPQIDLYYTERGVALYAHGFLPADQTLKVLWQERLGGAVLTLMRQGTLQLALDDEKGFRLVELPDRLSGCRPSVRREGFLLTAENALALLSREGELLICTEGKLLSAEETIKAEVPFHDALGHTALCEWRDGKPVAYTIRARGKPTAATLALALFESVLIGADARPFLAENLAKKADALKEYLGDYRSVVLTDLPEKAGLVYQRKRGVYEVRYFAVETSDGKISNIKPL